MPTVKTRFVLALTLAALLAAGVPARAEKKDSNLEKARTEVRAQQESALLALLRDADEKRRGIEESLAGLERKINDLQDGLDRLRPEVERAKLERDQATGAVTAADGAYKNSIQRLGQNAVSLYATGNWTDVLTLMSSADMASFASARVYLDSVVDSNARTVGQFRLSRDRLRVEKNRVEAQTQAIIDKTRKLEEQQRRLLSLAESKQRAANDLTSALAARADALAQITNDPTGIDLIVRSYGTGTNAIKLLVGAAQKGQPVEKSQSGAIWWPVEGRISSPFGPRIHPIYKYKSNHTGVDIAAEYGSKIRAARAGVVVDVVYLGAYGLVTVVDHGFSLATMYSHQARSLVRPGERVQQGQVIGAVGCTGWCTGPHLHFEVWSRGSPQNPLRWL